MSGSWRTAAAISAGIHVLLGVALVLLVPSRPESAGTVEARVGVQLSFTAAPIEEEGPSTNPLEVPQPPASLPDEVTQPTEAPTDPAFLQALESRPSKPSFSALSPEMRALISERGASAPRVAPSSGGSRPPLSGGSVVQASAAGPKWAANGTPVHGALDSKQSIVYVLDASGSMGEWGKFDAARAALIATLKLQPAGVRFQVVVYHGTASTPLRSPPGECRPVNATNIAAMIAALDALAAPAGRSDHVAGIRAALAFHPDLVVLFTDADDLPASPIRGLLKQQEKPVVLCVARTTGAGIAEPTQIK
jgi:hypothetical protein